MENDQEQIEAQIDAFEQMQMLSEQQQGNVLIADFLEFEKIYNICPYQRDLGNCLKQGICTFEHEIIEKPKSAAVSKSNLNKDAPEFVPKTFDQEKYAQEMKKKMEEFKEEQKKIFDPEFQQCECCKGYIHNCKNYGGVCQQLTACYCTFVEDMDEQQTQSINSYICFLQAYF